MNEITEPRVWVERDGLRIAADLILDGGTFLQPIHAELFPSGVLHWRKHEEGGSIPAIPFSHVKGWAEYKKSWLPYEDEVLASVGV